VVIAWAEREVGFRGRWEDLFAEPDLPLGCFPGTTLRPHLAGCTVHKVNSRSDWEDARTRWEPAPAGGHMLCLTSMMFLSEKQRGVEWFHRALVPSPRVTRAVEAFKREVAWDEQPGQWVGLHMRRTDLRLKCNTDECVDGIDAVNVLPLSAFTDAVAKVAALTAAMDRPRVFLATDDAEAERLVRAELAAKAPGLATSGAVVATQKHVRDTAADNWETRNDLAGIMEAVVDLHMLSQCQVLVGTVGSSYSQAAKMWGGPFFITVGAEYENAL
jgi:hypothetical protein